MPNLEPTLLFFGVCFVLIAMFGIGYTFGWFRGAGELEVARRELAEVQAEAVGSLNALEAQVKVLRAESESRARVVQEQGERLLHMARELELAQARRAS